MEKNAPTTFSSIRCPNDRPHNGFNLCGKLLGVIEDGSIYLYCEDCKIFYKLVICENDTVEMVPLPKNVRIKMKTNLRMVS